jgi:hypothetical protein
MFSLTVCSIAGDWRNDQYCWLTLSRSDAAVHALVPLALWQQMYLRKEDVVGDRD